MVFQYPEHQLFEETVAKDVAFGPERLGLSAPEVEERVRMALDFVGLPVDRFGSRSPFALSGGERRRAAIAGVLALAPRYLVLDEPTAGLDPRASTALLAHLCELHEKAGMTISSSCTLGARRFKVRRAKSSSPRRSWRRRGFVRRISSSFWKNCGRGDSISILPPSI